MKNYREKLRLAKLSYNENFINKSANKCKAAWNVINSFKSKVLKTDISNLTPDNFNMHLMNSVSGIRQNFINSNSKALDLLKNYPRPTTLFKWRKVSCLEIMNIVKGLKNSKTKDIFDINGVLVKQVINTLLWPLTHCINRCLTEGIFPQTLKLAKVLPIFKKGDRSLMDNYRPISIVPIFSKIIETVMCKQLTNYFESNNLLAKCQYGFRKGLSSVKAIEDLVSSVILGFEDGSNSLAMLCDLSKD